MTSALLTECSPRGTLHNSDEVSRTIAGSAGHASLQNHQKPAWPRRLCQRQELAIRDARVCAGQYVLGVEPQMMKIVVKHQNVRSRPALDFQSLRFSNRLLRFFQIYASGPEIEGLCSSRCVLRAHEEGQRAPAQGTWASSAGRHRVDTAADSKRS